MITTTARPRGSRGVDLLAKADELNVQMTEFVQDLEKV
jgi:hypothetical protein